ncbi:uncharacterized protein LY89DRAFT_595545 [Mollisia scopiformis]|uniref:Carbohydrate esterase family 16 protein n=1 Tax=Mollisia scopiformis TaxID=149040 RepID=A0A194WSJ3_MOLSC|nr:uncharacterized protein LY89DRAFT_595545 [Mollisia scopiformis]KUJ10928.1 hypothetical protein LY89DRAFT_595545 [Mollisia scopiformis]
MFWRTAIVQSSKSASQPEWSGWEDIKYTFIFGDSWTDTAFDPQGTQPNPGNPLGNPDFPGRNAANGTNWVGFLSTKYNESFLQTYNLAVSGATLDNSIVQGYPNPISVQVYQRFMSHYGDGHSPPWSASNSLFIMWAGIVDLVMMNGVHDPEALSHINGNLTIVYSRLLNTLYGAGARNFLLLNEPPLERTWQPAEKEKIKAKFASDVAIYNQRVKNAAFDLKKTFPDSNVFHLNTNDLFNQALDDAKAFPQTSGILNTTDPCPEYQSGTPTSDYYDPKCRIPVNQYFWLNGLHPTYPIHDVLAEHIAKLLKQGPNII